MRWNKDNELKSVHHFLLNNSATHYDTQTESQTSAIHAAHIAERLPRLKVKS